ncbi:MAG: leucine-rich repeat domain-containing protein [Prevotella sp.]|nr:leucine-rich repeat domain-containing protein [Prevotella sp.]
MKKQLLLLAMMLSMAANVFAVEVEIDGLWYEVVSKTKEAKVIKSKNNNYYGDIVIPSSVEYKGSNYSVTSIGENAFYACGSLTSIAINYGVKTIERAAIYYCWNLTSVTIPNSVTTIEDYAFSRCYRLTSITIPGSVVNFGGSVFDDCNNLTKVTILNGVTSIGGAAFARCSSLSSVTIPNSVTKIESNAFLDCRNLASITIPNNVTSIENYVFYNCSSLTSVTIPNNVTNIGYRAFEGCSNLMTITIGSGVKTIYERAFANCPELTDVYCYAEKVPSMMDQNRNPSTDAFEDSFIEYVILHVPQASINTYKSVAPWSGFKNIISLEGPTPETQKCATPIISYDNGKLKYDCETDGVEFISEITDVDIKRYYDATISLTATYNISVYATKSGYDNSDVATATLCWIDQEPQIDGIINEEKRVVADAVLIQSNGGVLTIQGVDDGTKVNVYNSAGVLTGSAIGKNGQAMINTNLQTGSIAIVMIGDKAVKVIVK